MALRPSQRGIAPDKEHAAATGHEHRWPRVMTVVLNWQRPDETLACVRSLLSLDYPAHSIVVIDNSAGAGGIESLLAGLPVDVVATTANLGFSGGVNLGLRHAEAAGADYAWLVNSDAVPTPGTLHRLVAAADADPTVGLVSPVFCDPDAPDTPAFCLALLDTRTNETGATNDMEMARRWLAERPDQVVLYGAALLVRTALYRTIGGFDDRFFAYAEDTDYCIRCKNAGFRLLPCFDAIVHHRFKDWWAEATPAYAHYFMARNYILLMRKHSPRLLRGRPGIWFLRQQLLLIERLARHGPAQGAARLAGLWDGVRGIGGPYDPSRRAPWWLRWSLGQYPGAFINLLDRRLPWQRRR